MDEVNAVVGKMVTLKVASHASQRTKNRIREHGPVFYVKNSIRRNGSMDPPS